MDPTSGTRTLMRRGSTASISPSCWTVPIQIRTASPTRGVHTAVGGLAAIAAADASARSLVTRRVRDRRASSMISNCSSIGRSSLLLIEGGGIFVAISLK
jgi:hypothetical protein